MNIEAAVQRYNLDEEMKAAVTAFDQFIWQDCMIESVEQLVEFEREYQHHDRGLGMVYDNELSCFGDVDMEDGPMSLLGRGRFQQLAESFRGEDSVNSDFMAAGLTELETLVIRSFRADLSELCRIDAYHGHVPPFARCLCDVLNSALTKLPAYNERVVRACNEYDKADFQVGDVFTPGFCLTTSADLTWNDNSQNRYRIKPLDEEATKARALYKINYTNEEQVTFLQDASFRIVEVNDRSEGKKEFVMEEL